MKSTYYGKIEEYYDGDAAGFEERYWQNPVLQRMRQDFREEVKRFGFGSMLEIGYGTGLDMVHFAVTHPSVQVAGIDISGEMHRIASAKIDNLQLDNAFAAKGKIEELEDIFPGSQFDMIYVFFGALNTVEDLEGAARILHRLASTRRRACPLICEQTLPGGYVYRAAQASFQGGIFKAQDQLGRLLAFTKPAKPVLQRRSDKQSFQQFHSGQKERLQHRQSGLVLPSA